MKNYTNIVRDAFALVDDIGRGSFNSEFSERGTMATTVEVGMPVLEVFRSLDPDSDQSIEDARAKLAKIIEGEEGVFAKYPALAAFAGSFVMVQ